MIAALILPALLLQAPSDPVQSALDAHILESKRVLASVRRYVEDRLPTMPQVASAEEWSDRAKGYRRSVRDNVLFRGEAARWRDLPTKPEWLGQIEGGPGYTIKKLRFEVVPGLWVPALLYEPTDLRGKVPVVLNVNGHDAKGKAADYKQIRCINQAKRGMIALSLEWFGMGQLQGEGFRHGLINAVDLCGTSGIALHYLAMTRGLDVLLAQENADPTRVGVTGLSGGGWQTIFISGLDERVTLSDPVAGYSSFFTRVWHESDLGDSEQTPCDLATVVDYTHLTAMRAPFPTLLTFNGKDNCCFAAPHALPPLIAAAGPIYRLFGAEGNLRSHVNMDPGDHNYGADNRHALYQMMADQWSRPGQVYSPVEIPCESEIKTAEALKVELPSDNLDFHTLSLKLARDLPRDRSRPRENDGGKWLSARSAKLRSIVRPVSGEVTSGSGTIVEDGGVRARLYEIQVGPFWKVPAVELSRGEPKGTTILIGDEGRAKLGERAKALLESGRRVVVVDLYGFGGNVPPSHVYLYGLLLGTVGERPLGVACGQLEAVAASRTKEDGAAPEVEAVGPRSGVIALVAAAMNPRTIAGLTLRKPMASLKEVIESGRDYASAPELFCFGLLESFDLDGIEAMVRPRRVETVR